jgi:hypothetical protein
VQYKVQYNMEYSAVQCGMLYVYSTCAYIIVAIWALGPKVILSYTKSEKTFTLNRKSLFSSKRAVAPLKTAISAICRSPGFKIRVVECGMCVCVWGGAFSPVGVCGAWRGRCHTTTPHPPPLTCGSLFILYDISIALLL